MIRTDAKNRSTLRTLALGGAMFLGCSGGEIVPLADPPGVLRQSAVTPDGNLTIAATMASQIVNRYAPLTANAAAGAQILSVGTVGGALLNVRAGDLLLVIQMQGATATGTDDAKFGELVNLNGAGQYELVNVVSVTATGDITIDAGCGGLRNSYTTAGKSQVVRVPQYDTVTVAAAGANVGRITALPWNGALGGIVAFRAVNVVLDGEVSATGLGFRGGAADILGTTPPGTDVFRTMTATQGADKGESIVGFAADYDALGGRYGKGPVANGGGGGNNHNGGGGGGANGGAIANWNGQGVMDDSTADFKTAWGLDPFVKANGNALTKSTGGGRGGYSFASVGEDPLVVAPGDAKWSGDSRSNRGGWGARPVPNDPAKQLFVGGGGGAGDANELQSGPGGAGGGLVLVMAKQITGTGKVLANGNAGGNSGIAIALDAAGGGGAGGTVVLASYAASGISVEAQGGVGGNTFKPVTGSPTFGTGGGGGGGYVVLTGNSALNPVVTGGKAGASAADNMAKFPMNGASQGSAGVVAKTLGTQGVTLPICQPTDLAISVTDGQSAVGPGSTLTYEVVVSNTGPLEATAAPVLGTLTPTQADVSWVCTPSKEQEGDVASCGSMNGTGDINTTVTLGPGTKATFIVTVKVGQSTSGTLEYTAQVNAPLDMNDPRPVNNLAKDQTKVGALSDLSLEYTSSPIPANAGDDVQYKLSVRNNGPSTATGVQVRFDPPAGATIKTEPSGQGWSCTRTGQLYTCTLDQLAANGSPSEITYVAVADGSTGQLTSSGSVSAETGDPNESNNGATASGAVTGDPSSNRNVLAGGGFSCSASGAGAGGAGSMALMLLAGLGLRRRRSVLRG